MKSFVALSLCLALASALPVDPENLPGGLHKLEVNDVKLLEVLSHVQPDLNARLNSMYFHKIGHVISAESQVVAGVKYHVVFELGQTECLKEKVLKDATALAACTGFTHVQICDAKILSQPWLNHLQAEQFVCQPKEQPAEAYFEGIAGGKHKMDVNDAQLLETLTAVQPQINDKVKSDQFYRVGKILEAESQVVSGVMYHIKFELGETQCLKEKITKETNILTECSQFKHVQICTGQIWSQPWLNHLELSAIKCELKKPDVLLPGDIRGPTIPVEEYFEAIAGGKHKMDLNDATLLQALTEVQPQINDKLNSVYFHRVGKVLEAESQVVSGVMYHIKFELGQTQCLKEKVTKNTNVLTECSQFSHVQVCTGKIWSQPWLHHLELSEVHCETQMPDVHLPGDIRGPTIPL